MKNWLTHTAFLLFGVAALMVPVLALGGVQPVFNPDAATVIANPAGNRVDFVDEGFEGDFPPDGWAVIHLGPAWQWQRSSLFHNTGIYCALIRDGAVGQYQDEWLVTPALDFSTLVAPYLSWYEGESRWLTNGEDHYIMVSTTSQTDPAAYSEFYHMTPATHTINGFGNDPFILDLADLAGEETIYLAFRYTGDDADWWRIDDVRVYEQHDRDIYALAVTPDGEHFEAGEIVTPQAMFRNDSVGSETFDVTFEVFESGTLIESESTTVNDLPPGETVTLDFAEFTVAGGNLYELRATSELDGDEFPYNDSASGWVDTYSQQRVPVGLLFTNSGCGPCVSVNQALDAYLPGQGDAVAAIRIHVWWPNGGDIMYTANPQQSQELVAEYDVSGVPNFFMDGIIESTNVVSLYESRKLVPTSSLIELGWNTDTEQLTVTLEHIEPVPPDANFRLLVAITEDNIFHNGGNGESWHHQAMRHYYPDTWGTVPVPTGQGEHQFVIDCPLDDNWVYDELRATTYLQDIDSRWIIQGGTAFLHTIETGTTAVGEQVASAYVLETNYPNPFNPSTTIAFDLPQQQRATLTVFGLDGKRVATLISDVLPAGRNETVWHGVDDLGQPVSSGTYFYRLVAGDYSQTRQMTLVK